MMFFSTISDISPIKMTRQEECPDTDGVLGALEHFSPSGGRCFLGEGTKALEDEFGYDGDNICG